jgi:hypothetical protein
MADGINIEGGFDDIDLQDSFNDGSIRGIILDFAQKLQRDLNKSIDAKGMNYTGRLSQSTQVEPKVIEVSKDVLLYQLEVPSYGISQDEGVNGTQAKYNNKVGYTTKPPPLSEILKWSRTKFGLNIPSDKVWGFAKVVQRKKLLFGIKPTYWLTDVINDGRGQELEEQLGKRIALIITERV